MPLSVTPFSSYFVPGIVSVINICRLGRMYLIGIKLDGIHIIHIA